MANLLSVCMMVKDGGKLFAEALESVKGFGCQICVLVDNATTDDTAEIARASGAEVRCHDWPDDFGKARTKSLEPATGKWILVLDHDEKFEVADIPRMIEILEAEEEYAAIRITTLNESRNGVTALFTPRFVRNGKVTYKGAKHHALVIDGATRYAPARIYHKGYNLPAAQQKAKNLRDIELLKKQIAAEPGNTYFRRNLIRSLRSAGEFEELLSQADDLTRLVGLGAEISDLSMQWVLGDVATVHEINGDYDQAAVYLRQMTEAFPLNPDGWFFLGRVLHTDEKPAEAAEALNSYIQALFAIRTSQNPPEVIVETWTSLTAAYHLLADCYLDTDDFNKYQQAMVAAHMQTQQDMITMVSAKLLGKIKQQAEEIKRLENPAPELIRV